MIYLVEKDFKKNISKYKTDLNINISDNPFFKVIVYVSDNNIYGYLSFEEIYDRIEIDHIEVSSDKRNNGIASKMLNYLIDYSKKNNKINITLEVKVDNYPAIGLYKKYNFEEVAIRKKYYNGIDGILMKKVI